MAGVHGEGDGLPPPPLELLLDALLRLQAHRELRGDRQGACSHNLIHTSCKAWRLHCPNKLRTVPLSTSHSKETPAGSH